MVKCSLVSAVRSLSLSNEFAVPSQHRSKFRRGVKGLADALVTAATERRIWLVNAELRQALEAVGKMAREIAASTAPSQPCAEADTHSTFRKLEADVRRIMRHGGNGGKPKPESKAAKVARNGNSSKWVRNWRKLHNPSLRETMFDLKSGLARAGLIDPRTEQPTPMASKRRVARIAEDGRAEWDQVRWVSIARKQRKAEKRERMLVGAGN